MPKHKKRKTSHYADDGIDGTDERSRGLTHEQIWDDSALLRSWNDALAEYRRYHSVYVSGSAEDVDALLDRMERGEDMSDGRCDQDRVHGNGGAGVLGVVSGRDDSRDGNEAQDRDGDGAEHEGEVLINRDESRVAGGGGIDLNGRESDAVLNDVITDGDTDARSRRLDQQDKKTDATIDADGDTDTNNPDLFSQRQTELLLRINGIDTDTNTAAEASTNRTTPQNQTQNHHRSPLDHPIFVPTTTDPTDQSATTSTNTVLENVKMAYYWAGYYSGLYDHQQQQQQQR